jgi:DNA-binding LacI/PurR family transcriptional regulator
VLRITKATIRDVAREAGVSTATVSRALNHKDNVSKPVETKVLEAAKRLNYKMPGSMAPQKTGTRLVAVVVPSLSNPFYNDILDGIQNALDNNNYNMVIVQSKSEGGVRSSTLDFFRQDIFDGLITLEYADSMKNLYDAINPSMPVVQCCEYDESLPYPYVGIDDYQAAYNAVSLLYHTGRRRIALLNSTNRSMYGKKRENGYRDALLHYGLTLDESLIYHLTTINFDVALSVTHRLLADSRRPDAIFTVSDIYAIAATRAAHDLNLRIPEDVAVMGFDNISMAAMNEPPLTTVNMPRYDIGSTSAASLMRLINQHSALSHGVILAADVVVRSST